MQARVEDQYIVYREAKPGLSSAGGGDRASGHTLCKHEAGLRQQVTLFHAYHNFVLPHSSLRLPLPDVMDAIEGGKRWQPRTPAMAAGLTDQVWSLRDILMYRVPLWPQGQVG